MIKYGIEFPNNTSNATIELHCYRHNNPLNPHMLPKHKHMEYAIKNLWPETFPNGEKGYIWSPWAYTRLKSWCYNEFQTWWGPAASGKSTDSAVLALTHWMASPTETTIMVCSTSMTDLKTRIWREIVRFHSMLLARDPSTPGIKKEMPPTITYEADADSGEFVNTINALFGIPIPKGTAQDAIRSVLGKHNTYVALIVDEMQLMHPCAVEAYDNVSTGCKESRFLGMGNPVSRLDSLGKSSEPIGGWNSISTDMTKWKTTKGITLFFDGLKSPGIADPKKYFFLLRQSQIDKMMIDPGPDSPRFWSQRRGFVPPEGLTETVLSENFVHKFKMKEGAFWRIAPKVCVGLDPAFSTGGDKAIYTPADYGLATTGLVQVKFRPHEIINLALTSGEPLTYDLAFKVIEKLIRDGITPSDLSLDTTSSQVTLADIIDVEWKRRMIENDELRSGKCRRVDFAGSASDKPFSSVDNTPCNEKFRNKVTSLWFMLREFGLNNQIRGMSDIAIEQFCTRLVSEKIFNGKISIESKREMRNRTGGRSPDEADSAVCVIDHVRFAVGIMPGGTGAGGVGKPIIQMVQQMGMEDESMMYKAEESLGDCLDF
jgi:hypothetical protein